MTTINETKLSCYNSITESNRGTWAALTAKYHGPTNTKGTRISVTSQHTIGRKYYAWDYALNNEENFRAAFGRYLSAIYCEAAQGCSGWGCVGDGVHGVMSDGTHVWVPCFHKPN